MEVLRGIFGHGEEEKCKMNCMNNQIKQHEMAGHVALMKERRGAQFW
jgi:hypothetical protein